MSSGGQLDLFGGRREGLDPQVQRAVAATVRRAIAPDPKLTVSEWADQYRILSPESADEHGPWRTDRTPYLRQIMDCLSPDSGVSDVTFCKGSQVGGTDGLANNWLGFIIDQAPAPVLIVQPTTTVAERYSKQRIAPMVRDTPVLREKVRDNKSRDSANTIEMKIFPGGVLIIGGANSAASLSSMPMKYLICDEVDRFPLDVHGEGDPMGLARARLATFSGRKILKISTPTIEGRSRITTEYEQSDQRRYHVPCPSCEHRQWLQWSQIKWAKDDPTDVWYECESCRAKIRNHDKTWMLKRGEWIAEFPERKKRGYHLSSLYSPVGWLSWEEIVELWLDAQGDDAKLKVFINTILGETWKERGDAPEWRRLYERREEYPIGTVPQGGLVLTGAVDVQADRLEYEIKAWGRGLESWSVEAGVISGKPEDERTWQGVDRLLERIWPHEGGGELPLSMLAVDSGYATQDVYKWGRRQDPARVMIVKGDDNVRDSVLGQPKYPDSTERGKKRRRRGVVVWHVGTRTVKFQLYRWLRLDAPTQESGEPYPAGYQHYPRYEEEWFQQLTAEELRVRMNRGRQRHDFEKIRERNEALDLAVYNRAGAEHLHLLHFTEEHWAALEDRLQTEVEEVAEEAEPRRGLRSRWMEE